MDAPHCEGEACARAALPARMTVRRVGRGSVCGRDVQKYNVQHTCNGITYNMHHAACNTQHTTHNVH